MTKTSGQLILSEEPVHRMRWKRPVPSSGVAIVGKTEDGRYEIVKRWGLITKYRLRFEVDIADHHDVRRCSLPSRGDVFFFDCTFVLDWRVTDAAVVVEHGIDDGLALCCARLLERLPQISRDFDIEACALAEAEINQALGAKVPIILDEGIAVHRFFARLGMDEATRKAIQELRAGQRDNSLAAVKSSGMQRVHDIEQKAALRRQHQRMEAIQAAMHGNYDLVAIHLSQHPDDTGTLINMIRSDYQANEERRDKMITELLKRDLIQDIDVDDLNEALLKTAANSYRSGPPRAINLPRLTTLPNNSTSSPNTTPQPAPPETASPAAASPAAGSENGHLSSSSGVVGWRRLPPRPGDHADDRS